MLRRLVADNSALAIQYAVNALSPLILVPHFVRTLGLESFGGLAIIVSVMSIAGVLVQYSFNLTGPAELSAARDSNEIRAVFLHTTLAKGLIAVLVAGVLAAAALSTELDRLLGRTEWFILLGLPIGVAMNSNWYLQWRGSVWVLVWISSASAAAAFWIGLAQVESATPTSSCWAAAAIAISPLVQGIGSLTMGLARLPAGATQRNVRGAFDALRRGRTIFVSQFMASLYSLAGPLVLGSLWGPRAAGTYSAVERPAAAVIAALTLTHSAAYPRLTFFAVNSRLVEYRSLLGMVIVLSAAAVVGLGVLLFSFSDIVIQFVLGDENAGSAILVGLAFCWIAASIWGPILTGYLVACGRHAAVAKLTRDALLVSAAVGIVLAARYGAVGWLIGLIAGQLLVTWRALRTWPEIGRGQHTDPAE